MAASNPPVNGVAYILYVSLQDMALPGSYKAAPTLAAGDVQVSIDGGAFANLTTLPTVTPAAGVAVKVSLSAAEMTGDNIFVRFIDQTNPKEWADYAFDVQTVAGAWNVGKTGYALSTAGVQAIWDAATSALTTVGSIGKLLVDNINATISSRSSHTAADIWAVATRILTAATNITSTGGTTFTQTGDSFVRLGAPVGASISADIAAIKTVVDAIKVKTDQLVFTIANKVDSSIQAAGDFAQAAADKVWSTAARVLTAGTNIVLAKGVGVTGFNDLSAAQVNTEADTALSDVGLTATVTGRIDATISSRLATAGYTAPDNATITAIAGFVDTEVSAIKAKTDNLPAAPAAVSDIPTAAQNADKLLGRNLAGGSDGGRTVQDGLRLLRNKRAIAAGTATVFQEDDATPAWTAAVTTAAGNPVTSIDPA